MTGKRYLLTLRKTASDYGVFLAVIVAVWLCFFLGSRWIWGPGVVNETWYYMNQFTVASRFHSSVLVPSFSGIFSIATCVYFLVAGTQTAKDMRNLNQMGTTKKTALLMSLSINIGLVLLSALIAAATGRDMIMSFGWRFLALLTAFLLSYGTTYLFNSITTYFKPLISTIIIFALLILPNPLDFLITGLHRQLIAAVIEIGIGTILFLTRVSMLKSENV